VMMEAVRSSESSISIYQTTRFNILEDSHIQKETMMIVDYDNDDDNTSNSLL
jgi:hypothetical protein